MGSSPAPSEPTGSPPRLRPRTGGLDALTKSPPRARPLAGGLGKEPNLRLARGPVHPASNETDILRIARGWLVNNPSLPPRPVFPTACHVPLMRQPIPQSQPDDGSTPRSGRWDKESHQRHAGWDKAQQGLPATVFWRCAHDQHLHYTVPRNPRSEDNTAWEV